MYPAIINSKGFLRTILTAQVGFGKEASGNVANFNLRMPLFPEDHG